MNSIDFGILRFQCTEPTKASFWTEKSIRPCQKLPLRIPSLTMVSEPIPLENYHSTMAPRWIPPDRCCLQNSQYLTNTFIVKASAFSEEHLFNRQEMAFVLTLDEEFETLLNDLQYMFGRQGLAKLYLCHKDSMHRCEAIQETNLATCLIRLQKSPTQWGIDIQFAKRPRGMRSMPSGHENDDASERSSGLPGRGLLDVVVDDNPGLSPSNVRPEA